ncbi:hypothetical protein [Promicromonospora umidemergens]|uniref:hypothetical protein n=1 Tax=Promicromonospora umidemergens TaxID=629679 RepID=UPI0020A61024|nr:hypothetical protein [Promicromonospora umidemergens]
MPSLARFLDTSGALWFDDGVVTHLTWELDARRSIEPSPIASRSSRHGSTGLASVWEELPASTKVTCLTLPPCGIALSFLGVVGDLRGWWEGFGFAANLLSSLTGLMFAVPFALVVVGRLAEHQDDVVEQRRVTRISRREWDLVEAAWSEAARLAPHLLDLCKARALPPDDRFTQAVRFTHLSRQLSMHLSQVSTRCEQLPARWESAEVGLNQRRVEVGFNPLPPSCATFLNAAADEFVALHAACREEPSSGVLERAGAALQALESMGLAGDMGGLEPLQQTLLFDRAPRSLGARPNPSADSYENFGRLLQRSPRPLPRVSLRSEVRTQLPSRAAPS